MDNKLLSAQSAITSLISEASPITKWQQELEQIRPQVHQALKAGVSRRKIIDALKASGFEIPERAFSAIFSIRARKKTKPSIAAVDQVEV